MCLKSATRTILPPVSGRRRFVWQMSSYICHTHYRPNFLTQDKRRVKGKTIAELRLQLTNEDSRILLDVIGILKGHTSVRPTMYQVLISERNHLSLMESIRRLRSKVDHEQNIVEERQSSIVQIQDTLQACSLLYMCITLSVLTYTVRLSRPPPLRGRKRWIPTRRQRPR